jgi:hypothetical protein
MVMAPEGWRLWLPDLPMGALCLPKGSGPTSVYVCVRVRACVCMFAYVFAFACLCECLGGIGGGEKYDT